MAFWYRKTISCLALIDISDVFPESNTWDVSSLILWVCEVIYISAIAILNRNVSAIKGIW